MKEGFFNVNLLNFLPKQIYVRIYGKKRGNKTTS